MSTQVVYRSAHYRNPGYEQSPAVGVEDPNDIYNSACALSVSQLSTVVDNDAGISLHPMPIHKSQRTQASVATPRSDCKNISIIVGTFVIAAMGAALILGLIFGLRIL